MFFPYIDTSSSKSFVPSEELLTLTNIAMDPKGLSTGTNIEEYNVGSLGRPKNIKLSRALSLHTKLKYIRLCKKFHDACVYRNESLKPCDIKIIQKRSPSKKYYETLGKVVSLTKKAKGCRLCIDFRYLGKTSMKYKYPFPKINHPMPRVGVSYKISLHDSVSGYHQMIPLHINQHEDIFKVPWNNYMFDQMLPGLRNAEDTF